MWHQVRMTPLVKAGMVTSHDLFLQHVLIEHCSAPWALGEDTVNKKGKVSTFMSHTFHCEETDDEPSKQISVIMQMKTNSYFAKITLTAM